MKDLLNSQDYGDAPKNTITGMDMAAAGLDSSSVNYYVQKAASDIAMRTEVAIRALIKQAPRFVPEWLWFRLAARFIDIEKRTTHYHAE